MIGDYDAAIDRLEERWTVNIEVTVSLLRFDPLWDPLRDHPRFQRLLVARVRWAEGEVSPRW